MNFDRNTAILRALGKIAECKNDLQRLTAELGHAALWLPGRSLEKQCHQATGMIDSIAERFERKLVLTLVGPSGSGKSTLLNALAGVDDLSDIGHQRPTTDHLIVFSANPGDSDQLVEELDSEIVETRSNPAAVRFEHVLLVDTPDTDSRAFRKHIPIVEKAIARSDMLICVFDAENPKRRDHVDFLARFIPTFSGESLVCVLNKCDRLAEAELKEQIVPDFLDEFEELQQLVVNTINQAGFVIDRRIENVKRLRNYVFDEAGRHVLGHQAILSDAADRMAAADKKALEDALAGMQESGAQQLFGLNVLVYQKLAQRWLGPMGWMIAIWARLLIFGSGLMAVLRFGRPVRQVLHRISALKQSKDSQAALENPQKDRQMAAAFRNYRLAVLESWPAPPVSNKSWPTSGAGLWTARSNA